MYSCKGSCHPVRTARTSAAEPFHRSSRSEGLLHSGNLSLRQQMHQTATEKTTYSANHQNITGIFMMLVKCMKTSTSRPYIQYVWILTRLCAHHQEKQLCLCDTWCLLFCVDDWLVCRVEFQSTKNTKNKLCTKLALFTRFILNLCTKWCLSAQLQAQATLSQPTYSGKEKNFFLLLEFKQFLGWPAHSQSLYWVHYTNCM